ncbi:glycosyltransferase family 2 protein [Gandjariella thermophila]|uniref:Glycosyl transferase n=1 Tax=Gandjariella thermophila TaxID=1931992 RepID=A0A4D4JGX1_9PSEU|nr:glycosyltransferase family 2 protein [Gandjariella thermophila]GDY33549.1 glycosyl transferase [Gandjariella thermophila]
MTTEPDRRDRPQAALDATAIVVTYNSQAHIAACLSALERAGLAVHVVDNASTDHTPRLVATTFPHVRVVTNPVNVGFAAAVNQALHRVDTDIVVLVNPDCVLPPPTAQALLHTLRADAAVGVVGPRLVGVDGRVAISAHPFESLTSLLASRFGGALIPVRLRRLLSGRQRRRAYDACRHGEGPLAVDWISGACLAVRTALLRQLGGLDEGYFMYYEDEELCLQTWRTGARVLYLPSVTAIHAGGASSGDPVLLWPHLYRSMLRFFARHHARTYPIARAAVLLRALLGMALAPAHLPRSCAPPGARLRAWTRVARIALTASRTSSRGNPPCTF